MCSWCRSFERVPLWLPLMKVSVYAPPSASYLSLIPSSMGHVESRVNLRGPPRKAKYSWVTDSEQVP